MSVSQGAICGDSECALRNTGTNFSCTDGASSIVGAWILDSSTGQYQLTSCPAGYEMQTASETGSADLQQCFPCASPSTYILNPDVDACQPCPPGLTCSGDATLAPKTVGSVWVEQGSYFKLESCPVGYYVTPAGVGTLSATTASQQECVPCGKGEECTNATCVACTPCAPGAYKAAISTEPCAPCPANTFRQSPGATEIGNCQSCPAGSDTRDQGGQSDPFACLCAERFYLSGSTCSNCPAGAQCQGGLLCALRMASQTCPGESAPIVGTWIRSTADADADKFQLVGCPHGYQTQNATHDTQMCTKCLENQYILDPDTDECQRCPPGLQCRGDNVVVKVVEGSTWTPETGDYKGRIYELQTCPTGYRKISNPGEWDQQKCEACAEGEECTLEVCDECTVCASGKYKDTVGTTPCRPCPANSYNPDTNSKTSAQCQSCPGGATTLALDGQTKLEDCHCSTQFYRVWPEGTEKFSCDPCPAGGVCKDFTCGLRKSTWKINGCSSGSIAGNWARDPVDDTFTLSGCPTGHLLQNATQDLQKCEKCPTGYYIVDPNNPYAADGGPAECMKCPKSAMCPGGGPPIFDAQTVQSSIDLPDFPPGSGDPEQLALEALAACLGVDKALIVLSGNGARRATVQFQIHASSEEMLRITAALEDPDSVSAGMSAQLAASHNISVTFTVSPATAVQQAGTGASREGEVWEEVDGQYMLRACGEGSLLVNSSLEDQECMACLPKTYTLSPLDGCGAVACFPRECRKCPKGAGE